MVEIGDLGARGALLKFEKLGTDRTCLTDGARGARGTDLKAHAMEEKTKQVPRINAIALRNATGKPFHRVFGFKPLKKERGRLVILQNGRNFSVLAHSHLRNDYFRGFRGSVKDIVMRGIFPGIEKVGSK